MAIAFDSATNGGITNPGTSRTWSHTCTGSDLILFVGVFGDLISSDPTGIKITGATYNGVAMTLINKVTPSTGGRWLYLFYLLNPATGANDVVVSASSSIVIAGNSASYTGVKQSDQPDATDTSVVSSSATSVTCDLTSVADNCWTFMVAKGSTGNMSAGSGSTMRTTENNDLAIFDSNGAITPAGTYSMTMNCSTTTTFVASMASFSPATGGTPITLPLGTLSLLGVGT